MLPSSSERKGRVFYPISYGENHLRSSASIHAEENCVQKLLPKKFKRIVNVSILVIRINLEGGLSMSKPCFKCIEKMNDAHKYGYRIKNVYYSTKEGNIVKTSLSKLTNEPDKHISKFFREKNSLKLY